MDNNVLDLQLDSDKGVVYSHTVTPGEVIVNSSAYMRGHGVIQEDSSLIAAVAGQVVRVNKLICVVPYQRRYTAEIGDVVIGRVTELGTRCWKVSIDSYQDAVMLLASIHLPGGIQAEIHSFFHDGAAFLQVRSLKYGRLRNGVLLSVPPALIKRLKSHMFTLPCGVDVILGRNGRIWVHISNNNEAKDEAEVFYPKENSKLNPDEIENISRVHNCILLLSRMNVCINPPTISKCYDLTRHLPTVDILPEKVAPYLSSGEFRFSGIA